MTKALRGPTSLSAAPLSTGSRPGYRAAVRQLFPTAASDVDGPARYIADERPEPEGRPWLLLDMVTSVDGATRVGHTSKGLSSPPDKAIFSALRVVADVVLVGASTVRAENYGPARLSDADQALRRERGQAPIPRIAVVSGGLDLDPASKLFSEDGPQPLVLTTTHADPSKRENLEAVAEVVALGPGPLGGEAIVTALHERGAKVVTCEGGPTLNGFLLAAGAVDEVCWAVAPLANGGESHRMAHGPVLEPPQQLRLDRALEEDGFLFLRYVR